MNSREKERVELMHEWYSSSKLHNFTMAQTAMAALRFSLALAIGSAKEGYVDTVLNMQERHFVALCKDLRECLKDTPRGVLVDTLMGMEGR